MDIENIENKINQSGIHKCLICENEFNWSFKLNICKNTALDKFNKVLTEVKVNPDRRVSFNTLSSDKVEFYISCPKCDSVHRTTDMDLLKKTK